MTTPASAAVPLLRIGGFVPFVANRAEIGVIGALALITTPQVWVAAPAQGVADADLGFPFLSGRGRLVLKDCIQIGAD